MQLEEYFNFLTSDDIRLKNSRIGIESILYEYIYRSQSPEQIAKLYSNLTLDQVYGTILYYLQNQEKINQYMSDWLQHCLTSATHQDNNPPEHIIKLKHIKNDKHIKNSLNEYSVST